MDKNKTNLLAAQLTKKLVDDGLIVEAGWVGFLIACKLKDAPSVQLEEMRRAFYAGSMHVFTSMLSFLEPGQEATDKDMARMQKLSDELENFQKDFAAQIGA